MALEEEITKKLGDVISNSDFLYEAVLDILREIQDDCYAHFPILWAPKGDGSGDAPPDDPTTIEFVLADMTDKTFSPRFSLAKLIENVADDIASDGSYAYGMSLFSADLHRALDKLDKALATPAAQDDIKSGGQ